MGYHSRKCKRREAVRELSAHHSLASGRGGCATHVVDMDGDCCFPVTSEDVQPAIDVACVCEGAACE